MSPESPPEPQFDAGEPTRAPRGAADARAEAEIASLPIPPWTTDDELVALWLHGKSPHTIRAYGEDVAAFRAFTGKGLRSTYLSDLQRYADALVGAPATRPRRLRARVLRADRPRASADNQTRVWSNWRRSTDCTLRRPEPVFRRSRLEFMVRFIIFCFTKLFFV